MWRRLETAEIVGFEAETAENRGFSRRFEPFFGEVKSSMKANGRHGSAVLHARSTEAVERLSRFFHGRQLAGSRLPISVSFYESQA